jgi:SAM-dependent methyltransferase
LSDAVAAGQPVTAALAAARIRYEVPVDGCATGCAAGTFDAVLSTNLLEHLSPAALRRLHAEQHRLLRPSGIAVHRVNPGDHFAAVDPRITTINFLRYSPRAWYWLGGSGLAYHNRLRCCDHAELLREAGFSIEAYEPRLDRRALAALADGEVKRHSSFDGYSANELCEDAVAVEARRLA